jgi:hypothetical protein
MPRFANVRLYVEVANADLSKNRNQTAVCVAFHDVAFAGEP